MRKYLLVILLIVPLLIISCRPRTTTYTVTDTIEKRVIAIEYGRAVNGTVENSILYFEDGTTIILPGFYALNFFTIYQFKQWGNKWHLIGLAN